MSAAPVLQVVPRGAVPPPVPGTQPGYRLVLRDRGLIRLMYAGRTEWEAAAFAASVAVANAAAIDSGALNMRLYCGRTPW